MLKSPVPSACPHRACAWAPDHRGDPSLDFLQFLPIQCSTHLDKSVLTYQRTVGDHAESLAKLKADAIHHFPLVHPTSQGGNQVGRVSEAHLKEAWWSIWHNLEQHQGCSHLAGWKDPSGLFCMWAFLWTGVAVGFLGIFFLDITVQKSRRTEQLAEVK